MYSLDDLYNDPNFNSNPIVIDTKGKTHRYGSSLSITPDTRIIEIAKDVLRHNMTYRHKEIVDTFNELSEKEPDKSTPYVLQLTQDRLKCELEDVTDALYLDYLSSS